MSDETSEFRPKFDRDGLITAVAIEASTGEVLMLAHMNEEALDQTLESGVAHYWSRSRASLWRKGETSGNEQHVTEIRIDCDQDAVLLYVEQQGDAKACHTGRKSCFYRRLVRESGQNSLVFLPESP